MLEISNLAKKIKNKTILNHITVSFDHKIYGLLGENGAGKTTLLRCIAGIWDCSEGAILYDGNPISENYKFRNKIGYLPQKFGVLPDLSVYEMMEFFASLKKIKKSQEKDMIMQCLSYVDLDGAIKKRTSTLSGGMIRRLGIAQALLGATEILLLDEATVGLDLEERIRFQSIMSRVSMDKTVIISTHVIEEMEDLCQEILVMHKGSLLGTYTIAELKAFANDRVYEVEMGIVDKKDIMCTEKQFIRAGIQMERILTYKPMPRQSVTPTLEEGYLCCIKSAKI